MRGPELGRRAWESPGRTSAKRARSSDPAISHRSARRDAWSADRRQFLSCNSRRPSRSPSHPAESPTFRTRRRVSGLPSTTRHSAAHCQRSARGLPSTTRHSAAHSQRSGRGLASTMRRSAAHSGWCGRRHPHATRHSVIRSRTAGLVPAPCGRCARAALRRGVPRRSRRLRCRSPGTRRAAATRRLSEGYAPPRSRESKDSDSGANARRLVRNRTGRGWRESRPRHPAGARADPRPSVPAWHWKPTRLAGRHRRVTNG